jgi:hypothetical protein
MHRTDSVCDSPRCLNRKAVTVERQGPRGPEMVKVIHDLGQLHDTPDGRIHNGCVSPTRALVR